MYQLHGQRTMMNLSTERCTIRRMEPEDEAELFSLLSDPKVMQYLESPYTQAQTRDFLKQFGLSAVPYVYAVCEKTGGAFMGYVIFHPYPGEDGYELGWVLHQKYWNQGYAKELTRNLLAYAHEHHISSLVIECAPEQQGTKAVALQNGFVYVGNVDQCDVYRRVLVDHA